MKAPRLLIALSAAVSISACAGLNTAIGGSGSPQTTCDPTNAAACGSGVVCVANSKGGAPACEMVPESDVSLALGCRACRTAADCGTKDATCVLGSCRAPVGYLFRVTKTVTADDTALGARCCPNRASCEAPDANGDRACTCAG